MYELVNTSLPNGLIAGTHGFATVAMTKGISDILRGRLEALCAYTHRTSVHDATYYRQNPVNWFHVVLPQGEHVVGRVAPSEFDYTGRTNRLAKLRVFGPSEMPDVGAAEVLTREKGWFSQEWQGAPRYLEEDRKICGQLRLADPVLASSAPSWEALLGPDGSRLAQQFAWLLEKNLTSGGKTIYFKTSAAVDVSGERMLGLFVDLINLLPVNLRGKVTFSTYPVALPGGTACNLRGVYDRDKFFDASSVTQAWIDCENARVVHPEMLPSQGHRAEKSAAAGEGNAFSPAVVNRPNRGSGSVAPRRPSAGRNRNSYRNILPPKQQGFDGVVVAMWIGIVVVLLAFGGVFFWMWKSNEKQMRNSGAAAAVEERMRSLEAEKEAAERKADEARKAQEREAREAQARTAREKEEAERKAAADKAKAEADAKAEKDKAARKADEDAKAAADFAAAKAKKERDEREKIKVAFLDAVECRRGFPTYERNGRRKSEFDVNDGCMVYYYNGNNLTNEVAGIKVVTHGTVTTGTLKWGEGLSKSLEDLKKASKGIVIWYNPTSKLAFIDLARRSDVLEDGDQWFASKSEVNLREKYFGTDENIEKLWAKFSETGTQYLISWQLDHDGKTITSAKPNRIYKITTCKEKMTYKELISETQTIVQKFDKAIKKAEAQKEKHTTDLNKLQSNLKDAQNSTNTLNEILCEYNTLQSKINSLKKNQQPRDEKIEGQITVLHTQCENILIEGVAKPTGKTEKNGRKFNNIQHLINEKESKEREVERIEQKVKNMEEKVSSDSKQIENQTQEKQRFLEGFEKNIKNVKFMLSVVGERIQE